jgi:cation diffusion facilitator CzcD-associated flavoprotein CzcO
MGSLPAPTELDALIVGAGFGGVYQLKRLRDEGFKVKLLDSSSSWGGVWYWNRYPGARVDSTIPHYEFSDPTLWKDWRWKQRFPGSAELREYFTFVAKRWNLDKDTQFNTFVSAATWDEVNAKWNVTTKEGENFTAKYLLLNTGFSAKRHIPDWPGINKFRGTLIHPSYWPKEEPDLQGKNIAVIGTGSTGVQLAQELSKVAGEFVLFQRTPNMAIPMKQVEYDGDEQAIPIQDYSNLFNERSQSFSGFSFNFIPRSTFDDTPEKRKETYEELWAKGDFHFWLATYYDMLFTDEANKEAYDFWKTKVRARINDPKVQEMLAPEVQPHSFGCKRISLENGFYEIFNKPNVTLVDSSKTPIVQITENGIKTSDQEFKLDYIVCATGYDAITGGLKQIDITGVKGQKLSQTWDKGTKTYLGLCVSGFPNMFFTYGPQAPTAFCNGPTCAELQGEWIVQMMCDMQRTSKRSIEARPDVQEQWAKDIWTLANASLLPKTKSVSYIFYFELQSLSLMVDSGIWVTTFLASRGSH